MSSKKKQNPSFKIYEKQQLDKKKLKEEVRRLIKQAFDDDFYHNVK